MESRPRTTFATADTRGFRPVRPSSEEIDERIIDVAARVFAQHGYAQSTVQLIADETGYSKTGLLHRFGSKERLRDAVRERCLAAFAAALSRPSEAGPESDREVVAGLVDLATQHPGYIALLLSGFALPKAEDTAWVHLEARALIEAGFGIDDSTPLSRRMRVLGCLGALGVGVSAGQEFPAHEVQVELEATCLAVLGL